MKKIIAILSAFALPAFADDARPYEFEVTPSCVWNKNVGVCAVHNQFKDQIECKVSILGKSFKGLTIGNTRVVVIPSQRFMDVKVFVPEGDILTYVSGTADCKAQ